MRKNWWKYLCILLIYNTLIAGLLIEIPKTYIYETIRNLFYHVGMWFGLAFSATLSLIYSLKYLRSFKIKNDIIANEAANVGIFFGIVGILTGMVWAKFTWGDFWVNDPKLNGALVGILGYFAYLLLRKSIDESHKRAKLAAVYNIFAYVILVIFVMILPKISGESIHPGNNDSAITPDSIALKMQWVFYLSALGWVLLALWIISLRVRLANVNEVIDNNKK